MDLSGFLRATHALYDVEKSLHTRDIDLVSGKCRKLYEGHRVVPGACHDTSRSSGVILVARACQQLASLEPSVI